MAEVAKVLGQSAPAATTSTDLYTVPALKEAISSTIVVCNRGAATSFRVSVAIGGAVLANAQYIHYDTPIPANNPYMATIGMTLSAGDIVRVYAGTTDLSFNLFGIEKDA